MLSLFHFQISSQKLECNNANDVANNWENLANSITIVKTVNSFIHKNKIKKLNDSCKNDKSKEFSDLIAAVNYYHNLSEELLISEFEEVKKMIDAIQSDIHILLLVAGKKSKIIDDKLTKSCENIDKAEIYSMEFRSTIEKCKEMFKDTVTSELIKMNKEIDHVTEECDKASSNGEHIKKDIEALTTFIQTETNFIKQNSEKSLDKLSNCIKPNGINYEAYMNGIYKEFQELFD